MPKQYIPLIAIAVVLVFVALFGSRFFVSVPAGHVAVAKLFGEVQDEPYAAGLHFPVNPLFEWQEYDVRLQSLKESANVPSQDQLQTKFDIFVRYEIVPEATPDILATLGDARKVEATFIRPKVTSLVREQGKSIQRAEDFFQEETLTKLQSSLETELTAVFGEKGIRLSDVLIDDITLPPFITRAIEAKKEREQEVEKQRAELERYRTEQQQKIAQAEAERDAAKLEAEKRRLLADAQAYEIEKINEAVAQNQAYIQLQALDALKSISKDPSSKLYFLDGDSPQPLPLMNIGEPLGGGAR